MYGDFSIKNREKARARAIYLWCELHYGQGLFMLLYPDSKNESFCLLSAYFDISFVYATIYLACL